MSGQIYRFDGIEVDTSQGCVRCNGEERHLRQQTFQVLVFGLALGLYLRQRAKAHKLSEITLTTAAGKKSVAVMFFDNQSDSADLDWLREGLADMLITDLSRSGNLAVLSRQQLHVLLERI